MQGLMQDVPLVLTHFLERAESLFADKAIVTATPNGRRRLTYGEWAARARRLGGVLDQLGVSDDGRVGTFAWNTDRHLELYFAAPCTGRVVHTINVRLYADQITYIVNHAEDEVLFVDRSLLGIVWPLLPTFRTVRSVVVMDDGERGAELPEDPRLLDYDDLLASAEPIRFEVDDERRAAIMCYTSGTTGNPKGVVYSHRSMFLHTLGTLASRLELSEYDRILPLVPMFHANAWGLPHVAVACGADLILAGRDLSAPAVASLMEEERVTLAAGVATIWSAVLPELAGRDTSSLRMIMGGGAPVPRALSEAYRATIGMPINQCWGMTETSPIAAVGGIKATLAESLSQQEQVDLRTTVGQPIVCVDARVCRPGEEVPLAWDGTSQGELQVRGPWIASSYYNDSRAAESFTSDGWLKTGDMAVIDPHGYVRLIDRTKDVIKSGGEWISSVELENELMAHPAVAEAAVIGVPSERWGERPLACVVLRAGASATQEELLDFLRPKVAKWWVPDRVAFIDAIPKTSVGKFSKRELRARFEPATEGAGSPVVLADNGAII